MRILAHVCATVFAGGVYYAYTQSSREAVACMLTGVLIDLDHVLDFYQFSKERFSIPTFFSWCNQGRWQKIAVVLHSYELYAILLIAAYVSKNAMLIAILWGAGIHLCLDEVGNRFVHKTFRLSPWFYFLSFRIAAGFRKELLRTDVEENPSRSMR